MKGFLYNFFLYNLHGLLTASGKLTVVIVSFSSPTESSGTNSNHVMESNDTVSLSPNDMLKRSVLTLRIKEKYIVFQ